MREEVGDEIRLHLELKAKKLMAAGLSEGEAHDEALRRFGSVERVIEQVAELTKSQILSQSGLAAQSYALVSSESILQLLA